MTLLLFNLFFVVPFLYCTICLVLFGSVFDTIHLVHGIAAQLNNCKILSFGLLFLFLFSNFSVC